MKHLNILLLLIIALFILTPIVSATYVGESRSATMTGNGFRVSLGIENVPGMTLTNALFYYNWICLGILFMIGAMSSKRMTRFFAILIPIFAALFCWFGWMNAPNPVTTWGTIIVCAIMGVITYMKGSLRENYGSSGTGSLVLNLAFYLILLQASVGLINATGVWGHNTAADMTSDFAINADLTKSIPSTSNTGGIMNQVAGSITGVADAAWGALMMLMNVLISLALFSVIINNIFPYIAESDLGITMMILVQLGIWLIYALAIVNMLKPTSETLGT